MYLNCHTGLSFKYGTLPIKTLFEEARRCDVHKLALTEINNVASYLEMLRICDENKSRENGLTRYGKPAYDLSIAVGVEFRNSKRDDACVPADDHLSSAEKIKSSTPEYIVIAKNNRGLESINRFLSYHNREDKLFPSRAPEFNEAFIIYPFGKIAPDLLRENEYIGVGKQDLMNYVNHPQREDYTYKFLVHHPVTLLPPERKNGKLVYRDHNAHRLLRCIAHNTLLSKLPEHLQASRDEYMLPVDELEKQFEQFPELLSNAQSLLDQCSMECKLGEDKNKKVFTHSAKEDLKHLREQTAKGYALRYGDDKTIWKDRIEKELNIIKTKGFTAYYLSPMTSFGLPKKKGMIL